RTRRGAGHRARLGPVRLRPEREALPGRTVRAVRQPDRARPQGGRRGRRPAGQRAGLLPALVVRASARGRAGAAARRPGPRRPAPAPPGDLNQLFSTPSGSEAVESAWKLAKQYFKITGEPGRYKVISRDIAYHGTSMGALAITGLPGIKEPFEPLTPGGVRVP